ncbi:ornithine cyclodeaminase family protein [Mesorhizobium sp. AR10]|uniref:ornithine cyclodeaminase family protein n=1 Tax=Mesorhizobium sp. AR10 TaxID=2865839 RepID=UPI00215E5AB8|nr:ornithine cyclodeaminase family protein [Mesorhizobium sp. AR10]UVK40848.1 ornithine cyclodeaminase family protein [Mesorhizobium sp. AR10]
MTMLKVADAETTSRHLDYGRLIEALERGFAQGCVVPMRHHHTIEKDGQPDATLLLMPAWSSNSDEVRYLGVKLVTVFPGNTAKGLAGLTSTYVLYDGDTGQHLAMLDGGVITARRTVATSALAARYLSREDSRKLLVLGSGRVASLIPEAYRAVRPIAEVSVWDINAESAARLVADLRDKGFSASIESDLEAGVRNADIVSAATLATSPLIHGEWLSSGTHVDLIGGFTPKMREADSEAVRRAAVYVDTPEALHEAGDLSQPIASTLISANHIRGTLAELARGAISGRSNPQQITLFKAVGSGLADLVAAKLVFCSL